MPVSNRLLFLTLLQPLQPSSSIAGCATQRLLGGQHSEDRTQRALDYKTWGQNRNHVGAESLLPQCQGCLLFDAATEFGSYSGHARLCHCGAVL